MVLYLVAAYCKMSSVVSKTLRIDISFRNLKISIFCLKMRYCLAHGHNSPIFTHFDMGSQSLPDDSETKDIEKLINILVYNMNLPNNRYFVPKAKSSCSIESESRKKKKSHKYPISPTESASRITYALIHIYRLHSIIIFSKLPPQSKRIPAKASISAYFAF